MIYLITEVLLLVLVYEFYEIREFMFFSTGFLSGFIISGFILLNEIKNIGGNNESRNIT